MTNLASDRQCGIVMPISSIEDCSASHWEDVRSIISEAAETAGFQPLLVSEANDAGLTHKRIFQNLYLNDMIVCDVSRKNPNVMFELGLRLAFDKPVVIIKDDKTEYSFDTGQIEHLGYPSDLRYQTIIDFKTTLSSKIRSTYEASKKKDYTSVLRNFGEFKTVKISESEVGADEYILEEIRNLRQEMRRISGSRPPPRQIPWTAHGLKSPYIDICMSGQRGPEGETARRVASLPGVISARPYDRNGHQHLAIEISADQSPSDMLTAVRDNLKQLGQKFEASLI